MKILKGDMDVFKNKTSSTDDGESQHKFCSNLLFIIALGEHEDHSESSQEILRKGRFSPLSCGPCFKKILRNRKIHLSDFSFPCS